MTEKTEVAHETSVSSIIQDDYRQELINWVTERWHDEVKNRPMVNVHRRSLDDTWRQILRHLGVDDRARLGPTHDELRSQIGSKEWEAMNQKGQVMSCTPPPPPSNQRSED